MRNVPQDASSYMVVIPCIAISYLGYKGESGYIILYTMCIPRLYTIHIMQRLLCCIL